MYGKSSYDELKDGQLVRKKDRDCSSSPVRADQGTRSGFDRRRRGPWPSVQKNLLRRFWTHSAFLKQHHQPLQAEVAPWPKGPRPKTPPPSISMHPASMLTLDQRSSTWKPKISRFFRKFADRRIGLYPWAKTDNWLLLSRSGKSERVPKPRKSKDFGTKPRRAGGDEAVKTAPADDFPTLFKPTTLISAKMELNRKELPKLFDQTKFLEQKHIKNYQYSEGLWL